MSENQPTLLLNPWQSKKVEEPLLNHNRLLSKGEGAQISPCKSVSPTTLQVWPPRGSPWRMPLGMVVPIVNHHLISLQEAKNIIDVGETKGLHHLSSPHLLWIVGFESNRSSLSMASSMSSRSDSSDGSWCPKWGRQHWEDGAHMKINLPVFKDEDAKDTVTYQSWRWELMMYQCAGCRDHTLLPYAIRSLQGYPGELVWSFGMDITLDDVLTILDEHYNNVKVLDALNQEIFQLWMMDKETISDWGICILRHL